MYSVERRDWRQWRGSTGFRIAIVIAALVLHASLPPTGAAAQQEEQNDQQQSTSTERKEQRNQAQNRSARQEERSRGNSQQKEEVGNKTDRAITRAIEKRLQSQHNFSAHLIDVQTQNGVVTLSGRVDDLLAREQAATLAMSTRGVSEVKNQLSVRPEYRPDEEIRRDVQSALINDPVADAFDVEVSVQDGVVTLDGTVQSWQERQISADVVKGIRGVRAVRNQVDIDFRDFRPDGQMEADIVSRLTNDRRLSGEKINVDVKNSRAILTGSVGSVMEKSWAVLNAQVNGVEQVDASGLEVITSVPARSSQRGKTSRGQVAQSQAGKIADQGGASQSVDQGGSESATQTVANRAGNKKPTSAQQPKRSDEEIANAVWRSFLYNPRVYSFNPEIDVEQGVVTLSGTVDNLAARRAAENEARKIAGVKNVVNLLKVRTEMFPDQRLTRDIEAALNRSVLVEPNDVNVSVINGKAYLSGVAESPVEKWAAEDIVSRVKGVVAVDNNVRVPSVYSIYTGYIFGFPHDDGPGNFKTDWEIRQDIEEQLFWSPFVDADEVDVQVQNGVVTLSGTVDDWTEHGHAIKNAYDGGAITVRNNLQVEGQMDLPF